MGGPVTVLSLVSDGAFGNHEALPRVKPTGLPVISKLRHEAARYFPDAGPYAGRGKRRTSGTKLDSRHLPAESLQSSSLEDGMQTQISPMNVWHQTCADVLNGVVMVTTSLTTQAMAHVV